MIIKFYLVKIFVNLFVDISLCAIMGFRRGVIVMNEPKKEDKPKRSKPKELTDQALIEHVADCATSVLKQEAQTEHEPFELYATQLQGRFHRKSKQFKERFVKGYEVLLEALHMMPHS